MRPYFSLELLLKIQGQHQNSCSRITDYLFCFQECILTQFFFHADQTVKLNSQFKLQKYLQDQSRSTLGANNSSKVELKGDKKSYFVSTKLFRP